MLGISALGGVADIQAKLRVPQTDTWDPATRAAVAAYQGSGRGELDMHVTGLPDPATLINLGYYDPLDELPARQVDFLLGRTTEPSTIWRDTATMSNQVPQWIWIVFGGVFVGTGYYLYRRNRREAKGK